MSTVILIHRWFGGLILPSLLLIATIWFTVTWRRDRWPGQAARAFRILVDIQFLLGFSFWIYLITAGAGGHYLRFPFLLHPIMGLSAATVANLVVRRSERLALTARLGRWTPLVSLGLMLFMVLVAGTVARLV